MKMSRGEEGGGKGRKGRERESGGFNLGVLNDHPFSVCQQVLNLSRIATSSLSDV